MSAARKTTGQTDEDRIVALLGESGELRLFSWSIEGEIYHHGSSPAWRPHEETGVIHAEGPYPALIKLFTGFGRFEAGDTAIELLPDGEREVCISIAPIGTDARD